MANVNVSPARFTVGYNRHAHSGNSAQLPIWKLAELNNKKQLTVVKRIVTPDKFIPVIGV